MSQRPSHKSSLVLVVVESHQHALEHVHSILRRRKDNREWSMLHFDAHPDLACPKVSAVSCFRPRQDAPSLYEELDATSSGIAEWILPLVLAGGLSTINWIKPPESQQLPLGTHEYNVGAWMPCPTKEVFSFVDLPPSARVCVDWNHPYYLEDDSVVPTEELTLAKKLSLTVSELPCTQDEPSQAFVHDSWALDICLDYFCCLNPFVADIETIDSKFTQALVEVVTKGRLHAASGLTAVEDPSLYKQDFADFHRHLRLLLQGDGDSVTELLPFYKSHEEGRRLLETLVDTLSSSPESSKLTTMALEALSNLAMPHEPSWKESIDQRLEAVQHKLDSIEMDPFIVTIARSANDGFTPLCVVEQLQTRVLGMVHERYCGCDSKKIRPNEVSASCKMQLIFDYGEWEGSSFE